MKPRIFDNASDALAASNANPFPQPVWRPSLTPAQRAVFESTKPIIVHSGRGRLSPILRWAARLKRIFS